MKTIVKGFCSIIIVIYFVLIMIGILYKSSRQYEVDTALNSSIMQTMNVLYDKRYEINSNEELVSEFHRNLLLQINSTSNLIVNVYGLDYQKGLLDVELILEFKYIDGRTGEVSARKTVLIEQEERVG